MHDTIFIQIAAYRDPQLIPTIDDCISNAKYPQNLRFGICNQTDNVIELKKYAGDYRFRILYVPYNKSKGVCWARSTIQTMFYHDETYTLQIDSHHRFIKNWDEKLILMLKLLQEQGYKKPLITSYIPSFNPFNDPDERVHQIWVMNFDRFIPEGAVFFMPGVITNTEQLQAPIPARFFSAHFAFTLGQICKEIPYDPNYYFHGEEISYGVRAYTHGYDLFHPNEIIAWHEYTREYRTKHWNDHSKWTDSNKSSHQRNRILFGMEENKENIQFGKYGFGTVRTLEEYEVYAGISFKNRSVQEYTLQDKIPPNPKNNKWTTEFKHFLDISKSQLLEKDYDFWCVSFHDKDDNTIYRQDADKNEIQQLLATTDDVVKILRKFPAVTLPSSWMVWPHSETNGWCNSIKGIISYE